MVNLAIAGVGRWGRVLVDAVAGQFRVGSLHPCRSPRTPAKAEDYCQKQGLSLTDDLGSVLTNPDCARHRPRDAAFSARRPDHRRRKGRQTRIL